MPVLSITRWRAILIACLLPFVLAACTAERVWAPDADVQSALYRHPGPPELALITMINNRNGRGGHSALVVNGSHRVLFDPAGSWYHRTTPERNDVFFGLTPRMFDLYVYYHARETYHVVIQRIPVSLEVANRTLALVQEAGPVPAANCSRSIGEVLRQIPGFESLTVNWYPESMMDEFARLPGVTTQRIFHDAPDDNSAILQQQQGA
jgi:hypothetical protein